MVLEIALLGFLLCLVVVHAVLSFISNRKYRWIPAAYPRLPFLGNAWRLDMSNSHLVLSEWAKRFGPVFRIRLYNDEILVLNNYESICSALLDNGHAVAGRPPMYRTDQAQRSRHSIVWQTYTPKLVFLRKEVLKSLKMYGSGLDKLEEKCIPEIQQLIKDIQETRCQPFDPWDNIYDAVCNVMLNLMLGSTMAPTHSNFKKIKTMNYLFNDTFGSGRARRIDYLPWTRIFPDECFKNLCDALALRDSLWQEELERLQKRPFGDCVVHRLLSFVRNEEYDHLDITETTVKEVFTNLILAGTDTTATSLVCLLLLFLHYPEVQERMYGEISDNIGHSRSPTLADRSNLPYTEAAIIELLRLISHVPLAVPHYTVCDTEILNRKVPANMPVYVNLWALHHDHTFWQKPWTFDPCRFLDDSGQILPPGHNIRRRVLAFGAGRRACLGEILAKNRLFLFVTVLVQNFRFIPVSSENIPDADPRTYQMGLVLHPKRFRLCAVSRKQ